MTPPFPLPRVRPDLVFSPDAVTDARFVRTLRPRPAERDVLDALRAGVASLPLLWSRTNEARRRRGEASQSPDDLYRRLWSLARDLWFELDALPDYDRLFAWLPEPSVRELPLDTSKAVFLCTGCGRCCDHTDVGPIGRAEARRIAGVVPGFETHVSWVNDQVGVLAAGCEACPYKRPDGLCAIHGEHGAEAKPLVCRQFPYRFTVVDGRVEVTLDAECWQLAEALEAGRAAPDDAARDVRAVWELGPIVERLPPVRFADPFTTLPDDAWEAARGVFDREIDAGAGVVEALLELLGAIPRRPPAFLDEAAWAHAFGPAFRPEPTRSEAWLLSQLKSQLAAWRAGAPWRAPLGDLLLVGLQRLAARAPLPPQDATARAVFVQVARSHLDAKNVLKKDNLELGVLSLVWRLRLAEAALGPRSAIDTTVASNKLLKDRRLGEYFRQNQVLFRRLAEAPVESAEERR